MNHSRTLRWPLFFALAALAAPGCSGGGPPPVDVATDLASADIDDAVTPDAADAAPMADINVFFDAREVPAETQRVGDPAAGYQALVNNGYVSCGVPWTAWSMVQGPAPANLRLPGRTGHNAELPYSFSATTTASGLEVVAANCLQCHASFIGNDLIVGLGNAQGDFTRDLAPSANLAGTLLTDPVEREEWRRWYERVRTVSPFIRTPVLGVNPADNLAAALFAHRDPRTLAWSTAALIEPPPRQVVPVDVPPWWRMARRSSMFYNASGRGDHGRIMMTASTLCTDSVEEARAIDAYFDDVRAYIASIRPPAWPYPVDRTLAARGETVFNSTCSQCHGSYGPGGVYPNLVVSLGEVGTDNLLAAGSTQFATRFVEWFNSSFYGETARLQPETGYIAPPLDGIWATAPFLHNGSVPTLAALLESPTRPRYWTRSFRTTDYNTSTVGWRFTAVDHGQADEPDAAMRVRIYDTTMAGYGNGGHTFGDALSADDRAAVLEYLKTL